jgi:hypothetical protein
MCVRWGCCVSTRLVDVLAHPQDKTKTIELLKMARKKDKAKMKDMLAHEEEKTKAQLKDQRAKFDKELETHLDFTQNVVSDKVRHKQTYALFHRNSPHKTCLRVPRPS